MCSNLTDIVAVKKLKFGQDLRRKFLWFWPLYIKLFDIKLVHMKLCCGSWTCLKAKGFYKTPKLAMLGYKKWREN